MAYFSPRSAKYVWLCLPGVASITLSAGWLVSVAPTAQQKSRASAQWRSERLEAKQRQDFLAENEIYSDYSQLIFQDTSANQPDLKQVLIDWANGDMAQGYAPGQVVRLLDERHTCLGYLVAGEGMYLEMDNPGLCGAEVPRVPDLLQGATAI